MKQIVTKGIVLTRTNYGEADRIITVLTPDQGKLRLIAKGVRKPKSRLAGGIELFSISDITFIRGRGDIGTLVSSRLEIHFRHIVEDIDRTMVAYDFIKQTNKATEDEPEELYFTLLARGLAALDDSNFSLQLLSVWFSAQLLAHGGYIPELQQDAAGKKLDGTKTYEFEYEGNTFIARDGGRFNASKIKLLRILFADLQPAVVQKVQGVDALLPDCAQLVQTLFQQYIRQ